MMEFDSVEAIEKWLADHHIDTTAWGVGDAKTVVDLWHEVVNGDCCLQDDPPLRRLSVVQILIRRGSHILIEVEQEFHSGQRRSRHLLPAEKIRLGEDYREAALRGLHEELGVTADAVTLLSPYKRLKTVVDSPSYPGLPTQYVFHLVEAAVIGLPETEFWRDNLAQDDPVKRQRWAWQPPSDLLSL